MYTKDGKLYRCFEVGSASKENWFHPFIKPHLKDSRMYLQLISNGELLSMGDWIVAELDGPAFKVARDEFPHLFTKVPDADTASPSL